LELDVSSISNNAQVNLTFSKEGADRTDATPKTCTVFFDKKTDLWTLNVSAWNYPWL
jgi:hypothetical protein